MRFIVGLWLSFALVRCSGVGSTVSSSSQGMTQSQTSVPTPAPMPVTSPPTGVSSSTFPDERSTGVPAGVKLTATSGRTISRAGTVIDSEDISGELIISADNVTVKNSRIRSSDYYVVQVLNGVTGFVIQDTELDGMGSAGTGLRTASAHVQGCNIHNSVDGILITGSNSLIEDNYIHDLVAPTGQEHIDPITNDGEGDNTIVRHNHIYLADPAHTTAGMTFDAFWGSITGVHIENNLIQGGTYVLRIDNSNHGISDVHILNNAFQMVGSAGYGIINNGEISGNFDYLTNTNIDSQL